MSGKLTLADLTEASSLLKATSEGIQVRGITGRDTVLEMSNVKGTLHAALSDFTTMEVTDGSDLTLTHDLNSTLGGVESVTVKDHSTLSLHHAAGQEWDGFEGSIAVEAGSKLHLGGPTKATLDLATGSTLSVKEGDLFAEGAGANFSLSGVTMEANEGNWTLNKLATVTNSSITGTHEVSFGSEVNSEAVVTMTGTIDATGGHLVVKNGATSGETTLTGHLTIENTIRNGGALTIADGSYIGINEESVKNCVLADGEKSSFSDGANGFLVTDTLVLARSGGSAGITLQGTQTLRYDGHDDTSLALELRDGLLLMHLGDETATEYFVNEETKTYTAIAAHAASREMDKIVLDGGILNLNAGLAEGLTILAATDHASVSIDSGIELYAGQTEIVEEGSVNELHVTGAGAVRIDAASVGKLSQLAGDATMKVDTTTTFSCEAKMTGALEVGVKEGETSTTLTVSEEGAIASFSSVKLAAGATLESNVADTDSIKSLSGEGTLSKAGQGMMAVKDASGFTGDIEATSGTLDLEKVGLTGGKVRNVSVSTGATVNLLNLGEGADAVLTELDINGGEFGVYKSGEAVTGANDANVGTLTLAEGNKIVVGAASGKLEANLTTLAGAILDFSAGAALTMGCDLNVEAGTRIVLNEEAYNGLMKGEEVTLFTGVDNSFCMEVTEYVTCNLAATGGENGEQMAKVYLQTVGGNAVLSTTRVPEPATGTLSLLALAGLMARRRRKS